MGENPEGQQEMTSFIIPQTKADEKKSEYIEELQKERIERRLSFYNKFANLKYGCILQVFSILFIITFFLLDTVFKIIQMHTNHFLANFANKTSLNGTKL